MIADFYGTGEYALACTQDEVRRTDACRRPQN